MNIENRAFITKPTSALTAAQVKQFTADNKQYMADDLTDAENKE